MDTVFLVRMRLMTSSWVQEEMEYPLIRTISSPTLATDRENTHWAAGQAHGQCLVTSHIPSINTLHQLEDPQGRQHFPAVFLPISQMGEPSWR